jgi:hypothetical protein
MSGASASASAAPPTARIYNSKEDPQEKEVSDIVNDTSNDNTSDDGSDDNISNKEDKETEADVFFCDTLSIMNQTLQIVATATTENRCFCAFFGAQKEIVHMVWDMLGEGGLRSEKCKPKHLLWALYFLNVYPREGPGCSAVGGLKGAVDPKTMREWVWRMLKHIAKLADHVVSPFFHFVNLPNIVSPCCIVRCSHNATDRVQKPIQTRCWKQLSNHSRQNQLLHPAEGGCKEGKPLWLPQVLLKVRPAL